MNVRYFLIATGSVVQPKLNLALFVEDDARAMREASLIAAQLHAGGYHNFYVYDSADEGNQINVGFIKVESQEPKVEFKLARTA